MISLIELNLSANAAWCVMRVLPTREVVVHGASVAHGSALSR
jgi:hypothetical protein